MDVVSRTSTQLGCCFAFQVTVLFAGQHISKSPFEVEIGMAQGDSSKATAQGPGLEPAGNIANKATYFDVYTAGSSEPQPPALRQPTSRHLQGLF